MFAKFVILIVLSITIGLVHILNSMSIEDMAAYINSFCDAFVRLDGPGTELWHFGKWEDLFLG